MSSIVIAEWPRTNREVFRVSLQDFNGNAVVSARVWYQDQAGELKPGRNGLTFGAAKHLPPLLDALAEAYRIACERGDIEPDDDDAPA